MTSHKKIEEELRELGQKCASVHWVQLYSAFLVTYPSTGAFRNHIALGCGSTTKAAIEDYQTKLNAAITAMNLGEKISHLERIKLTRQYEDLIHSATAE